MLTVLLSVAAALWGRAPTAEVRQALASVSVAERSVTVAGHASGVTAADRARVDATITRTFGDAPVRVTTTTAGPSIRWRVSPVIARVTPADLATLQHGFQQIGPRITTVLQSSGGATASGAGASTAGTIAQAVQVVDETIVVPLGILAVAGAVAVAMLGQLLTVARTAEDRLLRLRGASGARLVSEALGEAVLVTLPAVVVAGALTQLVLALTMGPPVSVAEVVVPPLVTLLLAVIALTATAIPSAIRPLAGDDAHRGGAGAIATVAGALVVLGAVCTWRYNTATDAAALIRDPLALAAPAVVLCALAAVATALLAPTARLVASRMSRRRDLGAALSARLIVQSVAVLAAPVLLVALAVATGTLAAGATATSQSFLGDAARLANGGAARMTVPGDSMLVSESDLLPEPLRHAASAAPTDDGAADVPVAPVLRSDGMIGDVVTAVVGVRAAGLGSLVQVDGRRFDASAVRASLGPAPKANLVLDGSTVTATVHTSLPGDDIVPGRVARPTGTASNVTFTLWLVDPAGDAAPVVLPTVPLGRPDTPVSAQLPRGGPWTVAGADIDVESAIALHQVTVGLESVRVDGKAPASASGQRWITRSDVFGNPAAAQPTPTIGATIPNIDADAVGGTLLRVTPDIPRATPVVISQSLADQTGLKVGDRTDVQGQVAVLSARVVSIIPVVPGTNGSAAMFADLPRLQSGYLAESQQLPNILEAWTASSDATAATWGLQGATVSRPSTVLEAGFVQASALALWLAAAGAAAFGLLTVAATIAALQRDRRNELGILRVLGVDAHRQARIRVSESGGAVVFALVAGALAGLLATPLIAPAVARTSAPSAPDVLPVGVSVDGVGLAVLIGVVAVAAFALLADQYRRTRHAAAGAVEGIPDELEELAEAVS